MTAQAIGKYEHGESMPSTGVLTALADALGVSTTYLTGSRDMTLEAVEFRRKTLAGKREEDQIKARVLRLLERYLAVEELLGLTSTSWDKPRGSPWPVMHDLSEVEHAARGLRAHWGLGLDPIPNLGELLEERGIKVLAMDLTAIDGLTVWVRREDASTTPVIVVNQGHWGERQRFTLAHELGHIALDVAPKIDGENAAHRFAAALLMPAEPLRAEVGRRRKSIGWGELLELKRIFGISVQALTLRCEELGIFSPALSRRLFDEFIRRGWRRPPYREPCAMVGEKPRRFERLVCRAYVGRSGLSGRGGRTSGNPGPRSEPPDGGAGPQAHGYRVRNTALARPVSDALNLHKTAFPGQHGGFVLGARARRRLLPDHGGGPARP